MTASLKTFLKFSIGTWVNAIVSLVSIPIITWFISPDELGKATMFTLTYNLLLNIFLLGQDQSFARFYNEVQPADRPNLLANTLTPAVVTTLFGIIALEIFREDISILLFSSAKYSYYVDWLSATVLSGIINRLAQLVVRMKGRALAYSFVQVIISSTNLLITIVYASMIQSDFGAVIVGFIASQFVCLMVSILLEVPMWKMAFMSKLNRKDVKSNINFGIPFVPTFMFDWMFQSTDRTMLRMYSTFAEIGIYSTATRISSSLNIIQTGFSTFWVPHVYKRFSENEHDKSFYQVAFESVYLTFSIAILLILSLKEVIVLILPKEYALSIDIFPLVLFVPMIYTLSEIAGVGINLKRKTIYHLYILVSSAVTSVAVGFVLIKGYGAKGAIVTNFCSYMVFFLLRILLSKKLYPIPLNWLKFWISFCIVMVPVVYTFVRPESIPYLMLLTCLISIVWMHLKTIEFIWSNIWVLIKKRQMKPPLQ